MNLCNKINVVLHLSYSHFFFKQLSRTLCNRHVNLLIGANRNSPIHHFLFRNNYEIMKLRRNFIQFGNKRYASNFKNTPFHAKKFRSSVLYFIAAGVFMIGATYAGVPLYRIFCQKTGLGGEVQRENDTQKIQSMKPVNNRTIKVRFNADVSSSMQWNFKPQQTEIKVLAGETALAFYRAKNPTDRPIIGISTYNVVPFEAGPYFNKIQCFCFEEQRLSPHEEIDMPVFFYIDPQFCDDPLLENVNEITLSYTFFESKDGLSLPLPPSYAVPHAQ